MTFPTPYEATLKLLREHRDGLRATREFKDSSRNAARERIAQYTLEIEEMTRLINSLDASIAALEISKTGLLDDPAHH